MRHYALLRPNSARAQSPASPCEITKTQSNRRDRLLSLSKTEYLVPKKAQMPGLKIDTKPKNEMQLLH